MMLQHSNLIVVDCMFACLLFYSLHNCERHHISQVLSCGNATCAGKIKLVNNICVSHPLEKMTPRDLLSFDFLGDTGGHKQWFRVQGLDVTVGTYGTFSLAYHLIVVCSSVTCYC